jgi:flagellin
VDRFYDANGRFLLDNPQTITLVDGTGKTASFTVYGNDTLSGLAARFNTAIGSVEDGLGMSGVATNGTFAHYIAQDSSITDNATSGTFKLSSAIAGNDGKITVIAGEQLLNAFGFTETQAATENTYEVTVSKAGMDDITATVQGNNLIGVIHKNVDVKFASDANVEAEYDDDTGEFTIDEASDNYQTTVHLADNTQVFQIGAGQAITKIDEAISRVSSLRSDLGAVQNRLEHTINNLGVAAENITASESRIRDVDMAAEMMEFTKLSILTQASTAMLAQANTQPQSVLQLMG